MRYVLEGSVRKASGNRVRITGQLIDALTRAHICGRTGSTACSTDIFELQDEVTVRRCLGHSARSATDRDRAGDAQPTGESRLPLICFCGLYRSSYLATREGLAEAIGWLSARWNWTPSSAQSRLWPAYRHCTTSFGAIPPIRNSSARKQFGFLALALSIDDSDPTR